MNPSRTLQKSEGIVVHGPRMHLTVENLKCGGCENTINKALNAIGCKNTVVNVEQCSIEFDTPSDINIVESAIKELKWLGYPLIQTEEGLSAALLKVKSFMSCALGKISS